MHILYKFVLFTAFTAKSSTVFNKRASFRWFFECFFCIKKDKIKEEPKFWDSILKQREIMLEHRRKLQKLKEIEEKQKLDKILQK